VANYLDWFSTVEQQQLQSLLVQYTASGSSSSTEEHIAAHAAFTGFLQRAGAGDIWP